MSNDADLVFLGVDAYTGERRDAGFRSPARAVAVKGNRIVYVGDEGGVDAWRGPGTRVVDGRGASLLPGFIDSHFHLMHGALALGDIQLSEVRTLADLEKAVRAFARENPDLAWLRGQGLRYGIPSPDEPLTRHHLDAIEANRPLVLIAYDVHTAWANTAALEAAGMLHDRHDPAAGTMIGDDGLPAGELREESAYGTLLACIPEIDDARRRRLAREALAWLASLGITSVHNMDGNYGQAAFYAALEDLDQMSLRVYVPYTVRPQTPLEALAGEAAAMRDRFQSGMVRAGAVKFFMDGVYESYTAVSLNGYPDQPNDYGAPLFDREHFARMVTEADRLGLQIFTHACGDGAVRRVLDGYETAQRTNGKLDGANASGRHRVEHIEMIHPDDAPRFAQLGVIASMQPLHAPLHENDGDVWIRRVREEDWDRAFAWRTMREAGATMVFGSDWPVALPDPILGIAAAVNRRPWKAGHDSHNQTVAEAIDSYTRDAAYAEFQEDQKGRIKTGMLADLVLLTDNIFAVPPQEIADVRVAMTVMDGRVVYER
ncbi:MAG: amidohydrolase [Candidatus Promineifilaceae bacterium]